MALAPRARGLCRVTPLNHCNSSKSANTNLPNKIFPHRYGPKPLLHGAPPAGGQAGKGGRRGKEGEGAGGGEGGQNDRRGEGVFKDTVLRLSEREGGGNLKHAVTPSLDLAGKCLKTPSLDAAEEAPKDAVLRRREGAFQDTFLRHSMEEEGEGKGAYVDVDTCFGNSCQCISSWKDFTKTKSDLMVTEDCWGLSKAIHPQQKMENGK